MEICNKWSFNLENIHTNIQSIPTLHITQNISKNLKLAYIRETSTVEWYENWKINSENGPE